MEDKDIFQRPQRRVLIGVLVGLSFLQQVSGAGEGKYGFFAADMNSEVLLQGSVWNIKDNGVLTQFSFLTCSYGEFLYQNGSSGDTLRLSLFNGTLEFQWSIGDIQSQIYLGNNLNNNQWYTLNTIRYLGDLFLNVSQGGRRIFSEILSNSTYRTYFSNIDLSGSEGIYVGRGYTGCMLEGPTVIFRDHPTGVSILATNVTWSNSSCDSDCVTDNSNVNECLNHPCLNGGTCIDEPNGYRCECEHLFNGTNCDNDLSQYGCSVEPCLNSGTCQTGTFGNRNYQCDCALGYTGVNCEFDINECGSSPCQHGSTCINKVAAYECNCTGTGYNGTDCETDIDECSISNICGVGVKCYNNPGSFTCGCRAGFIGSTCEDINECLSNPCHNEGTCRNLENAFSCDCAAGYTGSTCELDADDCVGITCPGANSKCQDGLNTYMCVCKDGYSGTPGSCVDVDECLSNPCQHGGTCNNLENAYNCTCKAGFRGTNCVENIDDCTSQSCYNGATCVDGVNDFNCTCAPGFAGPQCRQNIDECAQNSQPCYNGGRCFDGVNGYTCTCTDGYTGERCGVDIDECATNPCGIHSIKCTQGINSFTCTCSPGYTGMTCDDDIDECVSAPCMNDGTCTDMVDGYECQCPALWMGDRCDKVYDACDSSLDNCKNGASCMTTLGTMDFNCTCLTGFTGTQCEVNIDDCNATSCSPPFVCYDEVNYFRCGCPVGYEGPNCETDTNECESSPCKNGATCIEGLGNYTCQCIHSIERVPGRNQTFQTGYLGVNCEEDINECLNSPNICLNGGVCQNEHGRFQCLCGDNGEGTFFTGSHCEGSTSYCFIAEDVKDDQPACKNNGTCKGLDRNYTCTCAPGFTGRRCEINIDECESDPCQYNGTCIDGINGYTCDCIPGITGTNCEININDCDPQPCLYGGICIDGINSYECNCTDTGFKDINCSVNIDDCEPEPCYHGANCTDGIKEYFCDCYAGYTGSDCEVDIDECAAVPCFFNSTCLQLSDRSLYGTNTPGFENLEFSYATAEGYLCDCVNGSTGADCETNIDDCVHDNCNNGTCFDLLNAYRCDCFPGYTGQYCDTEIDECEFGACENGAACTDKIADYDCECVPYDVAPVPYAGKNCTFELTSCQNHECHNGATCRPFLKNEILREQDYECLCGEGFTGRFCNLSTTVSFNRSSIKASLTDNNVQVLFKFRTTLTESVLLSWAHATGLYLTVELKGGSLVLQYLSAAGTTMSQSIPGLTFNDGHWQYVKLAKLGGLSVEITSPKCSSSQCLIDIPESSISTVQTSNNMVFGNVDPSMMQGGLVPKSGTQFVGCMEDLTIQGTRLAPALTDAQHVFNNIVSGCPRVEQCLTMTCNQKGNCVDLWNIFRCDCFRPNLGVHCETGFVAATFSHSSSGVSYGAFSIDSTLQTSLQNHADISFFFRSRKSNGLIMFLGEETANYVGLVLSDGHVGVQTNLCGSNMLVATDHNYYASGYQQFVQFDRNETGFMLTVNGTDQADTIFSNCSFTDQYLIFGGPTNLSNRKKREIINAPLSLDSVGNFKGTIQDARLNGKSLQFFPLSDPSLSELEKVPAAQSSNLLENEVTDPVCNISSPCENNSTCHDVFYNDYRCDCLLGYRGKNCSELDFCVTGTCPEGSTCQSLLDGFECISVATFNGETSYAEYSHTLSNIADKSPQSFSFKFRTVAFNGKELMLVSDNTNYYKVGLVGQRLVVEYKLGDSTMTSLVASQDISDSSWYKAVITEDIDTVALTLYDMNDQEILSEIGVRLSGSAGLTTLLKSSGTTIRLGNPVQNNLWPNYQGCLTEVRIAGVLLPFFDDALFVNNTSPRRFLLRQKNQLTNGCIAGRGCAINACISSTTAACNDSYFSQICTCKMGYTGEWCQGLEDYCAVEDCANGQCVNRLDGAHCRCPAGYTGTRCEEDVNECTNTTAVCQNNGSCVNENGTFSCNCGSGFTGSLCEVSLSENCSDNPCVNGNCSDVTVGNVQTINCTCDPRYEGDLCDAEIDYCSSFPCYSIATCVSHTSSQTYTCICPAGFTGSECEVDINDCPANACQNGGECVDGIDSYTCNCTESWEGPTCVLDVNECNRHQPCQNNGSCVNYAGGFQCGCDGTGFTGTYCDNDVDECDTSPGICQNDGNCTNTVGSYYCNCSQGYEGNNCENPDCPSVPCENNSTCIITSANTWRCQCLEYYEGPLCEIRGPCRDEPCNASNTLTCTQDVTANTYDCNCKTGWIGDRCYEDLDECNGTNSCKNEATCVNIPGSYECDCAVGYTGNYCETNIDECNPPPCENGGYCIDDIGKFQCNCTGTGYTELNCTVDVDECSSSPCLYGGTCVNTVGSFTCTCAEGYEGSDCSVKVEKSMDEDITWYIVGPSVALVIILIVIGVIWFMMCVRKRRATRGDYSPSRQEVSGSRVELGNVLKKPPLERLI